MLYFVKLLVFFREYIFAGLMRRVFFLYICTILFLNFWFIIVSVCLIIKFTLCIISYISLLCREYLVVIRNKRGLPVFVSQCGGPEKTMCTDTTTAAHALTWVLRCHLCTQSEISQVSALQDEHNASNYIFSNGWKSFSLSDCKNNTTCRYCQIILCYSLIFLFLLILLTFKYGI